jgi:SHS2 domain-containing protein
MFEFQTIPHTADAKLIITADSKEELYIGAMQGMFSIMDPVYDKTNDTECIRDLFVESSDIESLLVDCLSEILCIADIYNESYDQIEFDTFTDTTIKGTLRGKKIVQYQDIEIKAVTYHELEITQNEGKWHATIVFDI